MERSLWASANSRWRKPSLGTKRSINDGLISTTKASGHLLGNDSDTQIRESGKRQTFFETGVISNGGDLKLLLFEAQQVGENGSW